MKVLIVDDEEMLVTVVAATLEMAGYSDFVVARDGREGLAKCRAERPDIVLLDVMLPHMNGYEVCKAIKSDPELGDTRIIMLTAMAQKSDVHRGIEAGAAAYLTKPFSPRDLLAVMKETLAAA